MTLEVNYVGSSSHRLLRSVDGNPPIPALVAAAQANGSLDPTISGGILRILPLVGLPQVTGNTVFDEPIEIKSIGNATYNGLQNTFHKRFGNGLDFQASYTWSHAIDDSNDPLAGAGRRPQHRTRFFRSAPGSRKLGLRFETSRVVNAVYELPFGTGHALFNHGFAARALGGWEIAGLSTLSKRPSVRHL